MTDIIPGCRERTNFIKHEYYSKKEFSFEFFMSMLMSHTSLHFFVLSFVTACVYTCVASEK